MAGRDVGMALWRQRPLAALVVLVVVAVAVGGAVAGARRTPVSAPSGWASTHPALVALAAWLAVLALAAALAVAVAVVRDRSTRTVDDAETVEEAASAPLLGHLDRPRDLTVMPALEPGSAPAGRFRHLRVTVQSRGDAGSRKVVVAGVTGGVTGGDADAWVGANLALALAGAGRRVLLVDGRMGARFGTPRERAPDTPGLYDVLLGADLEAALSPGPVPRLAVLPPGTYGDAPVADLIARRFADVMDGAAERFDDVVVIGPPLDVCDDSAAMAVGGAVGGALVLTVVEGTVAPAALRSRADRLRAGSVELIGVVLVGSRSGRRSAA